MFGNPRSLLVSPQHAILLRHDGEERFFRATHLARMAGGGVRVAHGVRRVSYVHILFERHQIVLSNGIWTESFYPGPQAMASIDAAARRELLTLFPALSQGVAAAIGLPARDILRRLCLPPTLHALQAVASTATCA
ncbi:Hint domain-containing protein [Loktanella fryxellensis]|uniref:Hint domain-containing protein n=1 Tax=Loktanella fryxellensis TaxID=245187 RepID=A0A1H8FRB1_9RHOB|nr:Hint domain-containing protein [Loktanella fryxellensis]